jgi:hypothetical protein
MKNVISAGFSPADRTPLALPLGLDSLASRRSGKGNPFGNPRAEGVAACLDLGLLGIMRDKRRITELTTGRCRRRRSGWRAPCAGRPHACCWRSGSPCRCQRTADRRLGGEKTDRPGQEGAVGADREHQVRVGILGLSVPVLALSTEPQVSVVGAYPGGFGPRQLLVFTVERRGMSSRVWRRVWRGRGGAG